MLEKRVGKEWLYLPKNMEELRPGDMFRMWHLIDDRWVLYKDDANYTEWITTSEPYLEDGFWTVKCRRRVICQE
jgi:hypothetical protein